MNSKEIRKVFLEYFEACGYTKTVSASLVPAGDPTLLFTNAGMVPFKDYFLGLKKPVHGKITTSQKCVRAGGKHNDLEQVGITARHHTFFEMLGNFVFQGASKEKAIREAWTLITEHYKISKDKLWVTVFYDDDESLKIWHDTIGLAPERVIKCGEEDNFWSMGAVGPCGPCTEIFYDHGESVAGGLPGSEDADGDRFTEIWNLVFMQYEMLEDGSRIELDSMGLDTGMGFERLCAVMQGVHNNFESDLFLGIIDALHEKVGKINITASRVIADHIRSAVFLILDQVYPSNEGRGYVLRRIIRRAMGFAYRNNVKEPFFHLLTGTVSDIMGGAYPDIKAHLSVITEVIKDEELRFHATIEQGMRILQSNIDKKLDIDGETAFMMYDTYGFPLDIARDVANLNNLKLDEEGYHKQMARQRERSRVGQMFIASSDAIALSHVTSFIGHTVDIAQSEIVHLMHENAEIESLDEGMSGVVITHSTPFYAEGGGQIGDCGVIQAQDAIFKVTDTQKNNKAIMHIGEVVKGHFKVSDAVDMRVDVKRRDIMCNHSATHLLHAALRSVLGKHVVQKGSLVTQERLRFDFTHPKPLTVAQLQTIERLVNDQVRRNFAQVCEWVSLEDARNMDIMALFDEKYEDPVRVVRFGDFSAELCGGTHVNATGEIGLFKFLSETGIASGVRRVEAVTGSFAVQWLQSEYMQKQQFAKELKCDLSVLPVKIQQLVSDNRSLKKSIESMQKAHFQSQVTTWLSEAETINNTMVVLQSFSSISAKSLRMVFDMVKGSVGQGVIVLQSIEAEKVAIIIGVVNCDYNANNILSKIKSMVEGKGGGTPALAQGVLVSKIDASDIIRLLKDV